MKSIVVNRCFGGMFLPAEIKEKCGIRDCDSHEARTNQKLIELLSTMTSDNQTGYKYTALSIGVIPDDATD